MSAALRTSGPRFDRVEIESPSGKRTMTCREFEAMPLPERVRTVISGNVRFFRGDEEIPKKEALLGG
jgi:hypothetical protein